MSRYLITCRSLTSAQKSSKLLEKYGIIASVIKAPQELTGRGCSYALGLNRDLEKAGEILRKNNLLTGKVFVNRGGNFTEV